MGSAKLCRPFTRLEDGPKSSAFWGIYFLPQPLKQSDLKNQSNALVLV